MWKQSSKKTFENAEQVYDYALNLLALRDYSGNDMLAKLMQKGAEQHMAEAAVVKLKEYNFINEERYAQKVYEYWLDKRCYGRQHLLAELHKKNVSELYIPQILEQLTDETEAERAEIASEIFLRRNAKKIKSSEENNNKIYAAAARFMAARGFSTRYIHVIMDKLHLNDDI